MIVLQGLTKAFRLGPGRMKYIAHDINAVFPPRTSVALLGRNGAGKSTLLKIIGGTMDPDHGRVLSSGRISWQIGFAGSFHPDLSGAQNTRFIARVYGVDTDALMTSVQDFAELGDSFFMPFRTYSSGMKARFAFGVSMGIPFTYYLIDEVTAVGDAAFRAKCTTVLRERLDDAGAIVVSHSDSMLRQICSAGAVLEDGVLSYYDNIDDAIERHNRNMGTLSTSENETLLDPTSPKAKYLAGSKEMAAGNAAKAASHFAAAIQAEPGRAKWHASLGAALSESGNTPAAIASYQEATHLAPLDARYQLSLARLLVKNSQSAEAIPAFRMATALNPSVIAGFVGLGRALLLAGQHDEARLHLERALQLDPDDISAHQQLLHLARLTRDHSMAERHARAILAIQPDHVAARSALAVLGLNNDNNEQARMHLDALLSADPEQSKAGAPRTSECG